MKSTPCKKSSKFVKYIVLNMNCPQKLKKQKIKIKLASAVRRNLHVGPTLTIMSYFKRRKSIASDLFGQGKSL